MVFQASSLVSIFPLQFIILYTKLIDTHMQLVATCVRIQAGSVPSEMVGNSIEKQVGSVYTYCNTLYCSAVDL